MIIKFKYGFEFKGVNYGWNKKDLYKLPIFISKRSYPLKKMNLIKIGNSEGYRIRTKPKTIEQLKEITEVIDYTYVINGANNLDCPW